MTQDKPEIAPVIPQEGWHVLHLFYQLDYSQWNLFSQEEKIEHKTNFTSLVQEICETENVQVLPFAVTTPKADLGVMLLCPDLVLATNLEKRITLALGIDVLRPVYSYLSMTERSEYTTTSEQYIQETLKGEKGLKEGSEEFAAALKEFEERMAHYSEHRLYPVLPDWEVICFYPMTKRRQGENNWYSLDYDTRRHLMKGHAATGRTYSGKILQLISGSTGLDEYEWGVTLLAHDTYYIKDIVYKMRFDEVSAKYGEFGDFYIGLRLPLNELFKTLALD